MLARSATWLAGLIALACPACADPVPASSLRAEIAGNTLSGFNTSGVVFSEFHSPDGRLLGHNNGTPVVEGCWDIRDDAICYYYAAWRGRDATFCWRYDRAGPDGYRITSVGSQVTGVARLESGNPHGHTDRGQPWVCEGLISGLGRRLRLSRR